MEGKLLYGDIYYQHRLNGWKYIEFRHYHTNHGKASKLFSMEGHSLCDACTEVFPSYKKLETMVGLKELTE